MPIIDDETIKGILSHPKFFRGHVRKFTRQENSKREVTEF